MKLNRAKKFGTVLGKLQNGEWCKNLIRGEQNWFHILGSIETYKIIENIDYRQALECVAQSAPSSTTPKNNQPMKRLKRVGKVTLKIDCWRDEKQVVTNDDILLIKTVEI